MKRRLLLLGTGAGLATLLTAAPALAQDAATAESVQATLDNMRILIVRPEALFAPAVTAQRNHRRIRSHALRQILDRGVEAGGQCLAHVGSTIAKPSLRH